MRNGTKAIGYGVVLLSTLGLTSIASAQISLSTAVDLATKNDPRVRMAQADLDHAKAGLAQTKDAYVPSVNISGGDGAATGVPLSVPVVFQINSQSLLFNFSQRDNLRAAASAVHSAELALKDAQGKVAEETVLTYIELDNAERRLDAAKDEYAHAQQLQQIIADRFAAGVDTKLDLHNGNLTADKIHLNLLETQQDVAVNQDHLARLVGLPGTPLQTVSNTIPPFPDPRTFAGSSFMSFGVRSAFASAHSKQESAFGEARYRWRPQISFGANYSRITTAHTSYAQYYPGFEGSNGLSRNSLSVGVSITIPLFDKLHDDKAKGSAADAAHARAEAEDARNQFLQGRVKLQTSSELLQARYDVAKDDTDVANDQLEATLTQLTAANGENGGPQLSPKDEQNARIAVGAKTLDMLNAQLSLEQTEINLLRQTNGLSDWLAQMTTTPTTLSAQPVKP